MTLSLHDILGPTGRIGHKLSGYEQRPEQLKMADAVTAALADGQHLIVEAGTGVGKSFAYLVPAILAATDPDANETSRVRRVVISTHTISLQEQLLSKDVPLLNSVIPREFSAVLVKGRGNYISLRRMGNALERRGSLFYRQEEVDELGQLADWARETDDGSRSDLEYKPAPGVWDEIASDSGNCMGRECPSFDKCFYYRARRRCQHAQLLIVNHALFFSDLALRRVGASILPDYDAVILDEAHTLEAVAGNHLGLGLTSGQIDYTLSKLYNDRTNKGLLVHYRLRKAQKQVDDCRYLADEFFNDIEVWSEQDADHNGRVTAPHIVNNSLSSAMVELSQSLTQQGKSLDDDSQRSSFWVHPIWFRFLECLLSKY